MKQLIFFISIFNGLSLYGLTQTPKPLQHFMQQIPSTVGAIPYGANETAGHYAKTGDARIYFELYGKGKPLVILHGGIFGSTYEMHRFIDSLAKYYQVIAVSTRGHGKSELGNTPTSYEQKANDVLAVIQEVTGDSVTVLGFSDGAYAGYKLASMYPGRVRRLITIGATEISPGLRDFTFDVKQAIALDSIYWKQQLALMPEPERLQEMFTKLGNMYNTLTLGKEFFQTIRCPVLVMAGDGDPGNPPQRLLNTAGMIPNSRIGIIPNTTHGVFLENFPAVWECIVPFLAQDRVTELH